MLEVMGGDGRRIDGCKIIGNWVEHGWKTHERWVDYSNFAKCIHILIIEVYQHMLHTKMYETQLLFMLCSWTIHLPFSSTTMLVHVFNILTKVVMCSYAQLPIAFIKIVTIPFDLAHIAHVSHYHGDPIGTTFEIFLNSFSSIFHLDHIAYMATKLFRTKALNILDHLQWSTHEHTCLLQTQEHWHMHSITSQK